MSKRNRKRRGPQLATTDLKKTANLGSLNSSEGPQNQQQASDSGVLRFQHLFDPELVCEVKVKDQPPALGQMPELEFNWNGDSRPRVEEYRSFMLESVIQTLSNRRNQSILYSLAVNSDSFETWVIQPHEKPVLFLRGAIDAD